MNSPLRSAILAFLYQCSTCTQASARLGSSSTMKENILPNTRTDQRWLLLAGDATAMPSNSSQEPIDSILSFEMTAVANKTVSTILSLQQGLSLPEHLFPSWDDSDTIVPPAKKDSDFDVNDYLYNLEYISLPEIKTLDWVYDVNWGGGKPVIYVRYKGEEPYATIQEYQEAECLGGCPAFLDELIPIGNYPQGYIQLAILEILADRFYLYWHAHLGDYEIVLDKQSVQAILDQIEHECADAPQGDDLETLMSIDLTPLVQYDVAHDLVHVSLVVFNMWGGFYRKHFTFSSDAGVTTVMEPMFYYYACWIY